MKKANTKYILNTLLFSIFCIMITLLSSCSNKINFLNSSVVPAAKGDVKITSDDNKNYRIDVNVLDLAESTRLTPPKNTYVVWIKTEDGRFINVGQIQTNDMNASLSTVSAFKPDNVFITAEDDANVQSPGDVRILTTGDL